MAQDKGTDSEINDLIKRFDKLSLKSNIVGMPPEVLGDIFQSLDQKDLKSVRLASRGLLPAAGAAMLPEWRFSLDQCRSAATAIYDHLLPEEETLPEYSSVNRQPYQPPDTVLTIQVAASLMNVIPEKQTHFVKTVLSIKDDFIRAQSLAAVAFHKDRFEKANLGPIVDEALRLSAGLHEGDLLASPIIPAQSALRRSQGVWTSEQQQTIEAREQSDWRFRKSMAPKPWDDKQEYFKETSRHPSSLKISEINYYSVDRLGHQFVFKDDYRIGELARIAQRISETTEHLKGLCQPMPETSSEQGKAQRASSPRDFQDRAPRGSGGRAD